MKTLYDFKLRALLAVTFLTASLVCVVLANPKFDNCVDKYLDTFRRCISTTDPDGTYTHTVLFCSQKAQTVFQNCLKHAGIKVPTKEAPQPLPTRPAKPKATASPQ